MLRLYITNSSIQIRENTMNNIADTSRRLAILRERRTVRAFTDRPVPQDILLELIEYARLAPSAGNRQAWRFIIVNDSQLIKKVVDAGGSETIGKSPSGILVLYEDYALTPDYHDNYQTAAACIQNLLLAAQAYDLGACWISILPPKAILRRLFKIPWHYSPIAYVAVGYPVNVKIRDIPRNNLIEDVVSENIFPMQGLGPGPSRTATYQKRLGVFIYRKLPILVRKKLKNMVKGKT